MPAAIVHRKPASGPLYRGSPPDRSQPRFTRFVLPPRPFQSLSCTRVSIPKTLGHGQSSGRMSRGLSSQQHRTSLQQNSGKLHLTLGDVESQGGFPSTASGSQGWGIPMLSTGDRHCVHTGRSGTGCPVRWREPRGSSLPVLMPGRVPGVDAGGLAPGKRHLTD